jgi:hypothetical protein
MKKDKLDSLIKQVEDAKKLMQETGASALKEVFQDFFDAHPEVRSVVWTQCTPYFNDGDPCVFGLSELELRAKRDVVASDAYGVYLAESARYDDDAASDDDNGYGSFADALRSVADAKENRGSKARGWNKNTLRDLTLAEQLLLSDFDEIRSAFNSETVSDICEAVFGDHVRVVAKPDGFETFSYEHD